MDCPTCGEPNPAGARFCGSCAAPLGQRIECPSCGAPNPPGQRYCNACAEPLPSAPEDGHATDATSPGLRPTTPEHLADKIRSASAALEGERKQVTVLFCDVRGSMELAEQTDPERWRAILDGFYQRLCAGVHRFEGTVDKFTGDGIMAIFGAPIAHEDHARRACYAALHLQRELASYVAELRRTEGLSFSVRTGLNSGEVVVGSIGQDLAMAYTAVGHTVGLAQRMEQLAAPDRIYLSAHTAALAEGYFTLQDLGPFEVKGVGEPLRVYELTGVGPARGALDVARARGLSRFVGRTDELGSLERSLEQALSGQGQVVGIVGEAGVGKSRLCHELAERCRARGMPVYQLAGQAHAASVPLMPVLRFLREYFEITEGDSSGTARERIAGKLLLLDRAFEEELPLIFDFLAVPDPERPVERMDPEARQRRLLALIKRLSHLENARQPALTVIEDLHWLDPASRVFLDGHVEGVQGTPGLTVLNFRPDFQAAWMSRSYYRQLALAPLGEEAVEELLDELLGTDSSLDGLVELIRERTRGNPFFVEELVRSLVESGSLEGERGAYQLVAPVDGVAVPATVQTVLGARIDQLAAPEKAALQAAAVIGREVSAPILARVAEVEAPELEDALRNLVAGELLYEQELYPEAIYAFKHPLTQEVAYGSQLRDRSAAVHAAVARAIIDHWSDRLDEQAALIAGHWEAAGEELEAARWHARAAAWSGATDLVGALRHWTKVRELADALPESPETTGLSLTARIYSLQLGFRVGVSLEEAEALFTEGERIAVEAGDVRSRVLLLAGYSSVRGGGHGYVREGARLGLEALSVAEESGDPGLYLSVLPSVFDLVWTGEYRELAAILQRGIELADGDVTAGAGIRGGPATSPYAFCRATEGHVRSALGELEQGGRLIEEGRQLAREHGDIEALTYTHFYSCYRAYFTGEPGVALAQAQVALELAERMGAAYARAWAWYALGLAEAMNRNWRRAVQALERYFEIARGQRSALNGDGVSLALLGQAYARLGDLERARSLAQEGLDFALERGQVFGEMIANVAVGQILLAAEGAAADEEIETAFARALELSRQMGTKVHEAIVHVELAELARQLGDEERREHELREAHRLFTETDATGHAERLAAELASAETRHSHDAPMSRHVELLRQTYDVWNREGLGAFDTMSDHIDPDVEFRDPPNFPGAGSGRGVEQWRASQAAQFDAWDNIEFTPRRFVERGDEVLAEVRVLTRGKETGIETERTLFQVVSFRDDRVVRWRAFFDRRAAFDDFRGRAGEGRAASIAQAAD